MWILTPDDPDEALVNLQHYRSLVVEQIDEHEFALVATTMPEGHGCYVVIKKSDDPSYLNSILLGIHSCIHPKTLQLPLYPMTTPTLH